MISALARSFSVITIAIVLTACSSAGDDAVKEAGSRENSFPGAKNPGSDFSETSTGDTSNANGLARNEVRITVEVPEQMAPEGPLSRRNLHLVQPDSVRVYRTDQNLRPLSSVDVNTRVDDDGFNVIAFPGGQPLGPDVLIEVSYRGQAKNSQIIRAFATDSDRDIKVNPFSEYLVVKGLGSYGPGDFAKAMDCVNSADSTNICINKYIWSTLADQVQDFEINIPDNTSFGGAVALLGQRADFASYVSEMAKIILIEPSKTSAISGQSTDMNTVFHGLELGITGTGTTGAGRWGIRRSSEERLENDDGVAYIYPSLSMSSLDLFGIKATFLASDIPYQRATLTQSSASISSYLGPDNWEVNSHATTGVPASIRNDTELLAGYSVFQTITNKNSAKTIGWTRNPYRLDASLLGGKDNPQAALSSYFSAGRALELELDSTGYQRGDQLEEYFVSIFDLSFTKSDDFQISTLSSSYNVISFSTQLGDPVTPFRTESMLGTWSGSGGSFTQTASAEEINRKANGTVTTASPNRDGPANVSNQTSQLSGGDKNTGRLSLDSSAIGQVGASQPDGSLLAFNLDNPVNGDGVLIALKAGNQPPEADRNYRLQGTIVGLNDDKQILQHIDGGQLSIGTAGDATVSLAGFEVTQTVSTQVLERPHALTTTTDADLTFTFTSGAAPQLVMTKTGGTSPYLQGFVSEDGSLLMLQIRERLPSGDEYLGLLIGVLEAP